jgi:N-acetylglucosaminyldiphosphoundecaprenol N-acetyl-beta-D-mannosaminyltransferase
MIGNIATLFGIEIAVGKREELLTRAAELIFKGGRISTVNPEIMRDSMYNPALRSALSGSLNIPDGIGIKRALSMKGIKTDVYPGVELGERLLDQAPLRLGIVGGREGVAERAMDNLLLRHPTVTAAFAECGYDIDFHSVAKKIFDTAPDIVMVCLGSPKQELFIENMSKYSDKVLFIGLGGSVDIYSEEKKRAPEAVRLVGCEWLYRMAKEPKRLCRLPKLADFALLSVMEACIIRKKH